MVNIAIGTHSHWKIVKHLYPDYKFYHEEGKLPLLADKILLVTSSKAKLPKIQCSSAQYIPEREYGKDFPLTINVDLNKPRLSKVEFHVSNHCNLNCDSCNHFCNLESKPSFPDIEVLRKDFERLKELYWGIGVLYLVGGEPFLNPDLDKFCQLSREYFPDSEITVITNGILLPKSDLSSLSKNEINLLISRYPITDKMMDKIQERLKDSHVKVSYTPQITNFTKKLTAHVNNNRELSHLMCYEKECHYLENGKIYGCTIFGRIKKLNEYFGTHYPDTGLNIYKYKNGWELNEKLEGVYPHCSYCAKNYQSVPWTYGGENKLENWIVDKPDKIKPKQIFILARDELKKKIN